MEQNYLKGTKFLKKGTKPRKKGTKIHRRGTKIKKIGTNSCNSKLPGKEPNRLQLRPH